MIRRGFRSQLLFAALAPTLVLSSVLAFIWLSWSHQVLETTLRERVEAVARQLAVSAEFHIFAGDRAALHALASGLVGEDTDIVAATVVDQVGLVLAQVGASSGSQALSNVPAWSEESDKRRIRLVTPITQAPLLIDDYAGLPANRPEARKLLGFVVLEVSLDNLLRKRNHMLALGVLFLVIAALVGGGLAFLLAKGVLDPIGRIVATVDSIGRGDLRARVRADPDCVLYPLEEGINRMAENLAMTHEEMQQRIDDATRELRDQKLRAEYEARIDPLTALNNRRAFMERAEIELLRANRYGNQLSLVLLDIDYFKHINDIYGHAVGDEVLKALAAVLRSHMREVDFVGRMGGEEFAIIMSETGLEEAVQAAQRIRAAVEEMTVNVPEGQVRCTCSFGVTPFTQGDSIIQDMLLRADRALYRAKQSGRNRVEHSTGIPT